MLIIPEIIIQRLLKIINLINELISNISVLSIGCAMCSAIIEIQSNLINRVTFPIRSIKRKVEKENRFVRRLASRFLRHK